MIRISPNRPIISERVNAEKNYFLLGRAVGVKLFRRIVRDVKLHCRSGRGWRGVVPWCLILALLAPCATMAKELARRELICKPTMLCAPYYELWAQYLGREQDGVEKVLSFVRGAITEDGPLKSFTYQKRKQLDAEEGVREVLEINLIPRPQIRNISFDSLDLDEVREMMMILPFHQGDYYTTSLGKEGLQTVRQYITEHGQTLDQLRIEENFISLQTLQQEAAGPMQGEKQNQVGPQKDGRGQDLATASSADNFAGSRTTSVAELIPSSFDDLAALNPQLVLFVDLNFKIKVANTYYVREIVYPADYAFMRDNLALRFGHLVGHKFNRPALKQASDDLVRELTRQGFYQARVDVEGKIINPKTGSIKLILHLKPGKRLQFAFQGNYIFDRADLMSTVQEILQGAVDEERPEDLAAAIKQKYRGQGYRQTTVTWVKREGKTREGLDYVNYYFKISEGPKTYVRRVNFKAADFFTSHQLKEFYQTYASPLAASRGLDENYINDFAKILKREYARHGLLQTAVDAPAVFDDHFQNVDVNYQIQEGGQTILMEINFAGISPAMATEIKKLLRNKEGTPFNVVELGQDIQRITRYLQESGYYWAKITNLEQRKFILYMQHDQQAVLNFEVHLGPQLEFKDIILRGNYRTNALVVTREIKLKVGDLITPSKLQELSERLESLGPFAQVKVFPLVEDSTIQAKVPSEIMIQVQERDFGLLEIAPGYRTDVGLKLGAVINYNNLFGKNRAVNFKTQINQRLEDKQFDPKRPKATAKQLEYEVNLGFKEPYFLGVPLELSTDFSYRYKRYFSFDARISAFEMQFLKEWSKHFSTFLQYQIESIEQKNSVKDEDQGYFRIGSIRPGIVLDWRDHPTNPRFGPYLSISWERSAPYLGSKNDTASINYEKWVVRHKLYYSHGPWTWAFSAAGGLERQMAAGYIPKIKVFRLEGIDLVRGYADEEINRILEDPQRQDINEFKVEDRAYFLNFKFGLRYLVNDNFALGPFFDAGRVYLHKIKHLSLRTAAGLGLRIITPVGSIDFDYGVKLQRRTYQGRRESVGRFNFSIGSF